MMAKRIASGLVASFMLIVLMLGCQPTPSDNYVVDRVDGVLEKAIRANPVNPYSYSAPQSWNETFVVRGQTVKIDAPISVSNSNQFPVLTVTKDSFDAMRCIDIVEHLWGKCDGLRKELTSYDELLTDIQNAQKGSLSGIDEETGELLWEPYEGQEEEIASLKALLATTNPSDTYIELTKANLGFPISNRALRFETGDQIYLRANENSISISKYRSSNIQLESWVMQGDALPGEKPHKLENIVVSEQDAIDIGNGVIQNLGLKGYSLATALKARATESYTYKTHGEGYLLTYVLCPEGSVACCYENYSDSAALFFTAEKDAYAARWAQEYIQMFVTENGILHFFWSAPKIIVNTANSNVDLLPFSQVQDSIRSLLNYGLEGRPEAAGQNNDLLITNIILGSSIQQIADQGDEAFLVPTWIVFLTTQEEQDAHFDLSVLMINALDGSYISRWGV